MSDLAWMGALRAAAVLGVAPEAFWRLSVREWRALAGHGAPGMGRAAFDALAAAYPDGKENADGA